MTQAWHKGQAITLVESNPQEGEATYAEMQIPTPAEAAAQEAADKDAMAEMLADSIAQGAATDYALGRMIFEIVKAQDTGDWTYFDAVKDGGGVSGALFKAHIKSIILSRL